uniref:granzyme F-like n=1 Tax=Podarcis muralis TaxID=64176 RepID=UPI00109F5722|nr:granzyme F-like [Podarcis muralis]
MMWRLRQVLLLLLSFSLALTDPLRSETDEEHEAKPDPRSYMAYLSTSDGPSCIGFLVAPQWVMTSALCDATYSVIRFNKTSSEVFRVEANYPHPDYDKYDNSNDIRLLKLNSKGSLTEYVNTLRLPIFDRELSDGTPCSVEGLGRVYEDVIVYGHSQCKKFYPHINYGKLCARRKDKSRTFYEADSGGPLVCNGVAEGINLYPYPGCPGVYTRIAHYLPWIKRTMRL